MRGLIIKDVRMLLRQKFTLLMLVAAPILLSDINLEYALGIFILFSCMLGENTIAYDSADNGMAYLMTLPMKRCVYALEKYILALLPGAGATVLALGIRFAVAFFQKQQVDAVGILVSFIGIFLVGSVLTALVLPVDFKFGTEKSRIVVTLITSTFVAVFFMLLRKVEGVQEIYLRVMDGLEGMSPAALYVCVVGIWFVLLVISLFASANIMEKKEF